MISFYYVTFPEWEKDNDVICATYDDVNTTLKDMEDIADGDEIIHRVEGITLETIDDVKRFVRNLAER